MPGDITQEPDGHLGILAVAAEAEGRGVGRALMEAVEQGAAGQGYRLVTLNVFATNERAIAMDERMGYQPDSIRYVKVIGSSFAPISPSLKQRSALEIALLSSQAKQGDFERR